MENMVKKFWKGKSVLLTGHTGFKGAWASLWLSQNGAKVTGLSLEPPAGNSLHKILGDSHFCKSHIVDIRNISDVEKITRATNPELVLHMAAQPIVRRSYLDPVSTFSTNILGTVNLLEAIRKNCKPQAVLVVTSDKVYENDGTNRLYKEADTLGGVDPYSASKASTELVVTAYRRSFYEGMGIPLATARGGNVIGGGDFSEARLVPDIVRALEENRAINIRNPMATRPWQYVLDCLGGYLSFVFLLCTQKDFPHSLNFGPKIQDQHLTVGELSNILLKYLGHTDNNYYMAPKGPKEMEYLAIDSSKAQSYLSWRPVYSQLCSIKKTADWYSAFLSGNNMLKKTIEQIYEYEEALNRPQK